MMVTDPKRGMEKINHKAACSSLAAEYDIRIIDDIAENM